MSLSDKNAIVLIVDDEKVMRDACSRALKAKGYRVATAHDGFSGIAKAREIGPDLILVDFQMPGMSGFEVLEHLDDICPGAVKSLITGNISSDLEQEVVNRQREWGYLAKPFTPKELRNHVKKALKSKETMNEQEEEHGS
jgi:two-component system response regulator (stage 0 sporulation protein F)